MNGKTEINQDRDPVHRAVYDAVAVIMAVSEPLSRYHHEICEGCSGGGVRRGGRFDEETRNKIRDAAGAAARALNMLAAVYRDIELIDEPPSFRIEFDPNTGGVGVDEQWGFVGLGDELILFDHYENQRGKAVEDD